MQNKEFPRLRECPFCGGEAAFKEQSVYTSKVIYVRCTKCAARVMEEFIDHPSIDPKTGKAKKDTRYTKEQAKEKAAERWNRRAHEQTD